MPSIVPMVTGKKLKGAPRSTCELILKNALVYGCNEIGGIEYDWPYNLARVKDRFEIYHIDKSNNTASSIEDDELYRSVLAVTETLARVHENFFMNHNQLTGFIKKLKLSCNQAEVKPFGFKSDPAIVEHRCSFDPAPSARIEDLVHWREFLDRISNRDAFMAFVGSMFVPDSKHEQYCWIYGDGGNGKSKVIDALGEVLGRAMKTVDAPGSDKPGQFWAYKFYTANLVVIREVDNNKFINSAIFKSLVSQETVNVEKKYHDGRDIIIPARYIILGNRKADIDLNEASNRRLIYCEVSKPNKTDPDFKDRLVLELPLFISACIAAYHAYYKNGKIQTNSEVTDSLIRETNEADIDIFHALFEYHEGGYIESGDAFRVLKDKFKLNNNSYSQIIKTWEKLLGIRADRGYVKGKQIRLIYNIRWRFGDNGLSRKIDLGQTETD